MLKRLLFVLLICVVGGPVLAWDTASQLPDKIVQMKVVPGAPNLVLAVTGKEVYRSSDGGLTWSRPGVAGHVQLSVHPRSSRIYALNNLDTDTGKKVVLLLSRNFGTTFVVQRTFDSLGDLVPREIFLDPYRTQRIYGVGTQGQPLVSFDEGKKWRLLRAPEGVHFEEIYVSPLNADVVYLSGMLSGGGQNAVLYISHDQGKTWELLTKRPAACGPQQFYDDPFFARILVSSCDGTKTLARPGIKTSSQLKRVASIVSVPGVFASLFALNVRQDNTANQNLLLSVNGGDSWKIMDSLQGQIMAVTVMNNTDKYVVVGTRSGAVYRRKLASF